MKTFWSPREGSGDLEYLVAALEMDALGCSSQYINIYISDYVNTYGILD